MMRTSGCYSFVSEIASPAMSLAVLIHCLAVTNSEARLRAEEGDIRFTRVTVDESPPTRPWYKMLGDIDGDGQLDIVVAGARQSMVWYKYPDWKKTEIATSGWNGVRGSIGDVDGDGDNDIVMGGVAWFSNPGAGGGTWKTTQVDTVRAHDAELGDLDQDGDLDIVTRDQSAFGKSGNSIRIYVQHSPTSWKKTTIPCPHGEGLKLADLDQDGDLDIVIGGRWYESTGRADNWHEREFTAAWSEPDAKVEVSDINGDRRPDVVLTPAELQGETYRIAWYEAPADARSQKWQEHVIVAKIECVIHSLAVGDFDKDGDVDVAIAEMHQGEDPDEVSVHLNVGEGKAWRKQIISTGGSHDIVAGDVAGDGDLDIVGANHGGPSHPLELWQNETVSASGP